MMGYGGTFGGSMMGGWGSGGACLLILAAGIVALSCLIRARRRR